MRVLFIVLLVPFTSATAVAADSTPVRKAVETGFALVARGATNYPQHRECFSCHHQALPLMAATVLQSRGFAVDAKWRQTVAEFSAKSLATRRDEMRKGGGVGGAAVTVGYGLATLAAADWKRDDTTDAMVEFLLVRQLPAGHWTAQTSRPPSEGSLFTATALAARGVRRYATDAQRDRADTALARAREWLRRTPPHDTEDMAYRLIGLREAEAPPEDAKHAVDDLLKTQREDGGWAQIPELKSDAYATGLALVALSQAGDLPTSSEAYQRGVKFLVATQHDDGSWFVKTRSKPVQQYFDNGDPYGVDQFISIEATAWATMALALVK